jgi:magnesium-transporting ATPase (P-type)
MISRWLHVGSLVYVRCDEQIPADLVLLATSNEDGICYIETSQLDGYVSYTRVDDHYLCCHNC